LLGERAVPALRDPYLLIFRSRALPPVPLAYHGFFHFQPLARSDGFTPIDRSAREANRRVVFHSTRNDVTRIGGPPFRGGASNHDSRLSVLRNVSLKTVVSRAFIALDDLCASTFRGGHRTYSRAFAKERIERERERGRAGSVSARPAMTYVP